MPYQLFTKLTISGSPPRWSASHRSLNWSMLAKQRPSHTGPQPLEASPMLPITMPAWRLIFLYSAAPTEMSPEPPTMALFG